MRRPFLALPPIAVAALLAACGTDPATAPAPRPPGGGAGPAPQPPAAESLPALPALRREFRGVWIATVANIDWPSRPGLPVDAQQRELLALLERARDAGLNAVVLHVRPAADALYRSALEPWGAMLTGRQGEDPGWDPLAFAVREAHARGLELHAWFNPFRAGNAADTLRLAATHVWHQQRALVRVYGLTIPGQQGAQLWLDPGDPRVHDRTMAAILDVVRRYDVDGVHLDDYFYPYQQRDLERRVIDFPDAATYAEHGAGRSRGDWRRENVHRFVERLYREVHAARPLVKVGISPFGIWRPGSAGGAPGTTGLDAYAEIYADSRRWLQQGWVDYLAPQLYWAIDPPAQSFTALLDWWRQQNGRGRHVWPGAATYRVRDHGWPTGEIVRQVTATRAGSDARVGSGVLLYNATTTLSWSGGVVAQALAPLFREPAVVPATPWLDDAPPATPRVIVAEGVAPGGGREWTLALGPGEAQLRWWVVRWRVAGGAWGVRVLPGTERAHTLRPGAGVERIAVHAADGAWNLSAPVVWPAAGAAGAVATR